MRRRVDRTFYIQALSECQGPRRRHDRLSGQLAAKAGARRGRRLGLGEAAIYWFCGFVMGYLVAAVLAAPVWAGK